MTQPLVVLTDRSRTITFQECPRRRYYEYHYASQGIKKSRLNIPLLVGGVSHYGLDMLLTGRSVDEAVKVATDKYWTEVRERGLQLEPGEDDAYVADEQCALIEAMLRAYSIQRLPKLLEEYEVLETEYEDMWKMYGDIREGELNVMTPGRVPLELWWMSRADALLLEKCSGDLYVQSFKTSSSWDRRRSREAEHDMQGLSEVASIEYRLRAAWNAIHVIGQEYAGPITTIVSQRIYALLKEAAAPPKIQGVRMEYLLKGDRYEDSKGSGTYTQHSPLIYGYARIGTIGTTSPLDLGWKQSWTDPDTGKGRKLDYRTWQKFPVWKHPGGVKAWIELLAQGAVQPEAGDCLEAQFISPMPYFRQDDDMRDWYEQTMTQEVRVARHVEELQRTQDEGEHRSLLNQYFPQHRRSCDWPSQCQFIDICYGTELRADPLGSGLYEKRKPNHAPEQEALERKLV